MAKSRASRDKSIKQAKKNIVRLTSQGVKINPSTASVFTNIEMERHRKKVFAKLGGSFDNSSQGASKAGGKFK